MKPFLWSSPRAKLAALILALCALLAVSSVSAESLSPDLLRGPFAAADSATSDQFAQITDGSEKIRAAVPVAWKDVDSGDWVYRGQKVGVFLSASTDLNGFHLGRPTPGLFIGVSHNLARRMNDKALLALEYDEFSRRCRHQGRFDYRDKFYAGSYDRFASCGGDNRQRLVLTTTSANRQSLILIRIHVASEADLKIADRILASFQVLGDPEVDEHHE